ncbi:MAG TPA: sugar transferase [Candidatus Paceibacterota bacterium]|nr:sugar transferase [Candidatus Paceibacterota bacterium]
MTRVGVFWRKVWSNRTLLARNRTRAVLVGSGGNTRELFRQVNDAAHFHIAFAHFCDTKALSESQVISWVQEFVKSGSARVVVLDIRDAQILPILSELYALSFKGVQFVDQNVIFEELNEYVALHRVNHAWLVENVSFPMHSMFNIVKRIFDLLIAIPLFIVSVPLYIPVLIALRRNARTGLSVQEYVGKNMKRIYLARFCIATTGNERSTKLNRFISRYHLDKLPRLFSVIMGDLSLIGPRPEVSPSVEQYNELIPYYTVRHFVTPGLIGLAQLHDDQVLSEVEGAQRQLAYDLFYMQHRSFAFDFKIVFRTVYAAISRVGA